jgi:Xaa-Pro aminopeptidase
MDSCSHGFIFLKLFYLNTNENDRKANVLQVRDYRFAQEMRQRYPLHKYERSARIMKEIRAIKSAKEVEVLKTAIEITDKTFRRLLGFIKPGVFEYEIEAEIWHEFFGTGQQVLPMDQSSQVETGQGHFTTCLMTRNAWMEK